MHDKKKTHLNFSIEIYLLTHINFDETANKTFNSTYIPYMVVLSKPKKSH
jgi:hypothetical protein